MCGLAGFYNSKQTSDCNKLAKQMLDCMRFRGPDNQNIKVYHDYQTTFGHNRLSIIDLSSKANQPMSSNNNRYELIYNGEIYNFLELKKELENKFSTKFNTFSDTEVLLESISSFGLYECVKKIEGMFAFALLDKKTKTISLARDRFGEKPLYYFFKDNIFAFSSDIKSFSFFDNFSTNIDINVLSNFLKYSFINSSKSIFKDVHKVSAGSILDFSIDNKKLSKKKYWSSIPKKNFQFNNLNEENIINELDYLIFQTIKKSSVTDKKIGCFLSGGVDSSLITSMYSSFSNIRVNTFTAKIESSGFKNDYDESKHAKKISDYLGTNHYEVSIHEDKMFETVDELENVFSEPLGDSSAIPTYLISKEIKKKTDVAVSGDGGDEIFGGYYRHNSGYDFWKYSKQNFLIKLLLKIYKNKNFLGIFNNTFSHFDTKIDKFSNILNKKKIEDYYFALLSSDYNKPFLNTQHEQSTNDIVQEILKLKISDKKKLILLDLNFYMQNDILKKLDGTSMFCSLEVRSPFLNHKIYEFISSLPDNLFFKDISGKYLLKKILSKYIPKKLFNRPKHGFEVPIKEWLVGSKKNNYKEIIFENNNELDSIIDVKKKEYYWKQFEAGRDFSKFFWNILVYQKWYKKYK